MIFSFLKYIQPTHYFQLFRKDGSCIFPQVQSLPSAIIEQLQEDANYQSQTSEEYDLSWQAIKKGYIGDTATYTQIQKLPVGDEYRFIKKYFHPVWAFYVLLLRLFTFKNPIREFRAYRSVRSVKQVDLYHNPLLHSITKAPIPLLQEKPLVSIVIPTLNRYNYLKDILRDFEKQTYTHFEVVIVDQSQPFNVGFYDAFALNINLINQKEPALWLARNTAIQKARGSIVMFSEDDVRIAPDWIENHLRCLGRFKADISAGVFFPEGGTVPKDRAFYTVASQFATGNAAVYKDVFKKIGLFDRQFEKQRMGDGEFGLRAFLQGLTCISTPYASCIDVKASTGGLRQMGSWDAFRPKKWFSPRPIPSVLYLFRRYFGAKRTYLALLKMVPPSVMPYRFKKSRGWLLVGAIISLFLLPIIVIQVCMSWKRASEKLRQGPLIGELD